MKELGRFTKILGVLLFALALTACGGGGGGGGGGNDDGGGDGGTTYSGSTSEATVDDTNTDDIGRASAEGTLASLRQEQAQDASPLATDTMSEEAMADVHMDVIREARVTGLNRTVGSQATSTVSGDCGGSAAVDSTSNSDGSVVTGSVVYSDYCVSDGTDSVIFNGTVDYRIETDSSGALTYYRFSYDNFRFTSNGDTQSLTATVECTFSSSTVSCTTSSDFVGSDGRTYRTTDYTVSGDASSGYDVSARVYDPDHGYVEIAATNITVCANGNIGTGTITVTDSTGTNIMTVTFTSCSEYTVTYNGVTDTYTW